MRRRVYVAWDRWRHRWLPFRWYRYQTGRTMVFPADLDQWTSRGWQWHGHDFRVRER